MRITILAIATFAIFIGCSPNETQSQIAPSGAIQKLDGVSPAKATPAPWKFVNVKGTLPPNTDAPGTIVVHCPTGYIAISGGWAQIVGKFPTDLQLYWNGPTGDVWTFKGWIDEEYESQGQEYDFLAICALNKTTLGKKN
jgi:hypothetical protein